MKKSHLLGLICTSMIISHVVPATAATIDYSSTSGSFVNLNPADGCGGGTVGCFDFTAGNNITINSGTATGFSGGITGLFGVGLITTTSTPFGPVETASVSGTGALNIFDGSNLLTATLSWVDIATFGTASNLNTTGTANLSNITYAGANADLLALLNGGSGVNVLSFQFIPPKTLTNLFTNSATTTSTSFSGSIAPIPVPAAVWLFGSGLLGMVGIARRKIS
jgi:hypothetical protein